MKLRILSLCLFAVLHFVPASKAATDTSVATPKATPPNILFIVSDDHSAPHLGCYGFPIKTPNFDRLASEGMLFDRMFVSAPQCAPSRGTFMTGRSPISIGMGRFTSEMLREKANYYTGICRRAHHLDGWFNPATHIISDLIKKYNRASLGERLDYVDQSGAKETTNRVNTFLDKVPAGRPFFLQVNFNDPHHPWDAPKVTDPKSLPVPAGWPNVPELQKDFASYCDELVRMDSELQSVLDILEKRGLSQNTIVVFTGDNGMPLPHGKGSLYDPGTNVPLIIKWPGVVKPGAKTSALVSGEDIAPTFLEAAGLAPDKDMTGVSIVPLLNGTKAKVRDVVFTMRNTHGDSTYVDQTANRGYDLVRSVRNDRFKLILNYTPQMEYQPVDSWIEQGWQTVVLKHYKQELPAAIDRAYFNKNRAIVEFYDLQTDPGELNNLAGQPQVAEVEHSLKVLLMEKMFIDNDPLPLPLRE
jgi:arylsulfatase A-like enzyme